MIGTSNGRGSTADVTSTKRLRRLNWQPNGSQPQELKISDGKSSMNQNAGEKKKEAKPCNCQLTNSLIS